VKRLLEKRLGDLQTEDAVHCWADSCFAEATEAAICGLDDLALKLFDRARTWWCTIKDENAEAGRPTKMKADCLQRMTLTNWLLDGHLNVNVVSSACDRLLEFFETTSDKTAVARDLPTFIIARRYEELIALFDANKKLKKPSNINRIQCPGRMSYTLATFYANDQHGRSPVVQSLEKFLRFHFRSCLSIGVYRPGTPHEILQWVQIRHTLIEDGSPICFERLRDVLKYVPVESFT
jgi:hypothetical protein